jgi:transmembrane sensor
LLLSLKEVSFMQKLSVSELITKYLNSSLSQEESELLNKWLNESKENEDLFIKVRSIHNINEQLAFCKKFDREMSWNRLNSKCNHQQKVRRIRFYYAAAAVVALIVSSAWVYSLLTNNQDRPIEKNISLAQYSQHVYGSSLAVLSLSNQSEIFLGRKNYTAPKYSVSEGQLILPKQKELSYNIQKITLLNNSISIPRGGEYSVMLSDGTTVKLNSDSKLDFPTTFGSERDVALTGEAFFDVAHDADHPFCVKIGIYTVQVLGTRFNVSAYPNENIVVTLLKGKIKVSSPNASYILSPGMQFSTETGSVKNIDPEISASWTRGAMEFDALPLPELMKKLSRWYNVDLQLSSKDMNDIKFTGIIFRDKPLSFALDILHKVSEVNFEKRGNVILVVKNKSQK